MSICRCSNPIFSSNAVASRESWSGKRVCSKSSTLCFLPNFRTFSLASGTECSGNGVSKTHSRSVVVDAKRRRRGIFELEGDSEGEDEEYNEEWESDIFEDFDTPGKSGVKTKKKGCNAEAELGSIGIGIVEKVDDWAVKARERAILSIQERGLPVAALLEEGRKKKKKKNRMKKQAEAVNVEKLMKEGKEGKILEPAGCVDPPMDSPLMAAFGSGQGFKELSGLGNYWKNLNQMGEIRIQEDTRSKEVEFLIESNSELVCPGPKSGDSRGLQRVSNRQRRQEDFDLNRSLVEADSASEVLSVVERVFESSIWGQDETLLSPTNVSTALHRIAKHMESESMHKGDRLSFARKKTMALLVSAAIQSLAQSSAQSISNIAWALSKVGGSSLYWTEMDLLADVAMKNMAHLKTQHIANIAGAFASMQHSVSFLFEALDLKASLHHRSFQSQELAQLLWAFATLNEPANLLLNSLDSECDTSEQVRDESSSDSPTEDDNSGSSWISAQDYFGKFSLSQLSSLSWSYTVLGEMSRPSFQLLWGLINTKGRYNSRNMRQLAGQNVQLSQLYQASLSLQLEFPELKLSLEESLETLAQSEWAKLKAGKKSTSVTQKDVEMLLVSTGRAWVGEYSAASHSLDAALVEERIAFEIDGPTHFARNTGIALGHTVLKRRQLSAAGWTVLSVPYQEWDDLRGEQEQLEYLRDLLREHL